MLVGGVSAGVGKFATLTVPVSWGVPGQLGAVMGAGGLSGGAVSAMTGGSFTQGFALGAAQATYGYFCNYKLSQWLEDVGGVIYGIKTGVAEGVKGGSAALEQAAYALTNNQELHRGVEFGFKASMIVVIESFVFVGNDIAAALTNYVPLPSRISFWSGRSLSLYTIYNNFNEFNQFSNSLSQEIQNHRLLIYKD